MPLASSRLKKSNQDNDQKISEARVVQRIPGVGQTVTCKFQGIAETKKN